MMALLFLRRTLMRTMLIGAVMLLACLSGAARADEASAVKVVEKLGGKVTRDDKLPGKPVIGVDLNGPQVTDADLKELADLKQLTTLWLNGTGVTDAGLKELADLKQLTSLWVNGTQVTGEGARELQAALPKLKIDGAPELKEVVAKRKAAAEKKKDIEDRQIRMQLRDGELYLTGHTVVS